MVMKPDHGSMMLWRLIFSVEKEMLISADGKIDGAMQPPAVEEKLKQKI